MNDPAGDAPPHLLNFLEEHGVKAEFLAPGVPMPTVSAAAEAINVPEEQILKTLLFVDDNGTHVVAIASGTRRVDRQFLAHASGLARPRAASPDDVMKVLGYPAGGVAPLALTAGIPVIVDLSVTELPVAFGGGGKAHLLLRVLPADIVRLNNALVASIVQPA